MWLKAKGDDFYRARDYQSAVNAYTEALALAPERSDLAITCLSNRAAAHLQLLAFDVRRILLFSNLALMRSLAL